MINSVKIHIQNLMKNFYFFILLIIINLSCQSDITPSWLEVNEVEFTTNFTSEGVNSHAITDAWVYLDNQSLGVWEIPFRMPILEEGEHKITIFPGIKKNGFASTKTDYPFYTNYSETINLKKENTTTIVPKFEYSEVSSITFKEDFEDTGSQLNPEANSDSTKIKIINKVDFPEIVKYGNSCAKITLNNNDSVIKVTTDLNFDIVQNEYYLELDYLSNNIFAIGIISTDGITPIDQLPEFGVYASDDSEYANKTWKKMYFDIASDINLNKNASTFDFYIYSNLDSDSNEGVIYLDNIKLVRY